MITIRLYQNRSKARKDGTAPVYYVLAKGTERKYISTQKYLHAKHFDNESGTVLRGADNSIKLNAYFKRQMTVLDDIIIDITNGGDEPTFEKIEAKYRNDNSEDFISFALSELRELKGTIAFKTWKGYENRLENLKKYKTAIPFNTINHTFLTSLKHYLITVKKRKVNGCYQDFACIKKFYRIAVLKGKAKGNPFENFKLSTEETVRAWLTKEELLSLYELLKGEEISEAIKNTLRHFLFSCFTGLRFGDKVQFNDSNIVDGRIQLKTSKTGKPILVPFNDQAKELLLPVLSRQLKVGNNRVNDELEICMDKVKINKHITYHCSRHTFAINCIMSGIDIITVRDWLGHTSVTTTEIYAKIAAQYKDESMKKFDSFFKKDVKEAQLEQITYSHG
ncbi:MAG: site-specific integrase [Bacteroidetes bacterium]|nr:site-specific integrase [Bacteroidota bacterium]MBS1981680.1 site-specific integrase [Bacteroidota bacterium]